MSATRRTFLERAACITALAGLGRSPASAWYESDPFAALPASAWANARRNGLVMVWRNPPATLSPAATIMAADEPGERLRVQGRIFAPDGNTPAVGVTVYAYNTDREGYYGAGRKEYPPRLHGWMKTDDTGRFELHTVMPGCYPDMQVPAHIHFVLWGGGYPLQWVDDMQFAGGRYLTAAMMAEDARKGRFARVRPVERESNGELRAGFDIRLGDRCNFS
jgi:protocatechuate 3,4-dioxygenase beta subunit